MIARIRGTLLERRSDAVVVEAAGVGYLVRATARTLAHLPAAGRAVDLYTHLHVTEGALDLYGFGDTDEQHAFELLLRVSGIGPRTALQILSAISPMELGGLVVAGDKNRLRAIPGIGPKTADRLIVELRDAFSQATAAAASLGDTVDSQAVAALVALGLKPVQASEAVRRARHTTEEQTLEDLVREALRQGVRS